MYIRMYLAGYLSGYSDWLRAGWYEDRIPVGGEIFRTSPHRPWGPPSLLYNGYRVFLGGKERSGSDADASPFLLPCSRNSRIIPLLPLWVGRPVQSLSACTRVHFTFYVCMCVCMYIHTHTHTHSRVSFCDCSFYDDSLLRPL